VIEAAAPIVFDVEGNLPDLTGAQSAHAPALAH
jgi:hypothetical protein